MDSVLRNHRHLEGCAVTCRHCGIRFLTDPRNAHRIDLYCPFGCRLHNRRQRGNARSKKLNETDKGKANKKKLNNAARIKAGQAVPSDTASRPLEQSRQLTADSPSADFASAATVDQSPSVDKPQRMDESPAVDTSPALVEHLTLNLDGFVLDERDVLNSPILPYVRMVASVLERRTISREELIAALLRSMRQRSMARAPHREYVLRYLNQHPP